MDKIISEIAQKMTLLDGVESVMLSGSQTNGTSDSDSDYDLYVYTIKDIDVEARRNILNDYFAYSEIDNRYWEVEDDGILKNNDTTVEIIYRSIDFVENEYKRMFERHEAWVGYSTCIWYNIANSELITDKNGKGKEILNKFKNIKYPLNLKNNIINKNFSLLTGTIPAYYNQIEKAIIRKDLINLNNRVSAFLASYFDIIFALNEKPNPGEKKILQFLKRDCKRLPENYEKHIKSLIDHSGKISDKILSDLNKMIEKLKHIL